MVFYRSTAVYVYMPLYIYIYSGTPFVRPSFLHQKCDLYRGKVCHHGKKSIVRLKRFILPSGLCRIDGLFRGKKITCPGARDKFNFRQDKHLFSPNVQRTSKKFSASILDNIFRTSYLAKGQVKI